MHKETLEENSRLVDQNESLHRLLSEAQEEVLILKRTIINRRSIIVNEEVVGVGGGGGFSSSPRHWDGHPELTSMFIGPDMKVPTQCPLGGCSQYEMVHQRGSDAMKNFQNHMNNTHRVRRRSPSFLVVVVAVGVEAVVYFA